MSMIMSSWRESTQKQYLTYIHRWIIFCRERNYDVFTSNVTYIIEFLGILFQDGLSYSSINTARSAISAFLGVAKADSLGSDMLVTRFMKGVSRSRPTVARYKNVWDVRLVLDMFRKQPLPEFLSLYDLSMRTVTLLALVSAQRSQSIHLLDMDNMPREEDKFSFTLCGNFKQSRIGHETLEIILPAYQADIRLCIVRTLGIYLDRTAPLRKSSKLFISTIQPFQPVSKDTISRWIRLALQMAGIDVGVYKAHSTRAAATSAAQRKGVNVKDILKVAGWAREATFARFYSKPLLQDCEANFANAVLTK